MTNKELWLTTKRKEKPMSENTGTEMAKDPMEQSCDEIDISFPIIPASSHRLIVKSAERGLSKKQKEAGEELDLSSLSSGNLKITWMNTTPITSTKGESLEPGRVVMSEYIGLTPTEASGDKKAYTTEDIKKRITRVVKAVKLQGVSPADIIRQPSMLKDREALVKVKVRKETADYDEGNEVAGYTIED